jgi:hypothetical protein
MLHPAGGAGAIASDNEVNDHDGDSHLALYCAAVLPIDDENSRSSLSDC